ncbi:MAG: phosphoribosylamine--glycine ligase [Gammaproteobacteria bacterium]|nr:phosphoribosylamine--glycine ligase [Gammaproteobacteria bacterium]
MKVLVIGSGGREHSLAWKCAQSPEIEIVFVAPGNAGTAGEEKIENVDIGVMDFSELAKFAQKENVSLTIVGPEAPLVEGIVDFFNDRKLPCFGPTAKAAQLEGSKAFTKDFCSKHRIPTAPYQTFAAVAPATNFIRENGAPIVIKADGLAAGKGVIVAFSEQEAISTVEEMLSGNSFGEAGHRVVIEKFLEGEEATFIAMVDGKNVIPMATSQDHKARDDGDKGPNTGGMGAYSPAPVVTDAIYERIMKEVVLPTVTGMASDGNEYTGFLYAGLMISSEGSISVIEFNCRFGDPEAQPVMLRLKSELPNLCLMALDGKLDAVKIEWDNRSSVGVVLASAGYPGNYKKGDLISGLDADTSDNQKLFHAGTIEQNGEIVTNGGRVLCATALGDTISEAQSRAYKLVNGVNWENMYFRKDIAYRAIARENN